MSTTRPANILCVISLNYNGLEDTINLVNSLKNSIFLEFDIIIVDNGSKENEAEIIQKKFPFLVVLKNKINLGFAAGFNKGISFALSKGYDFIFIVNNDTVIEKKCISELLGPFQKDPFLSISYPKIRSLENKEIIQYAIPRVELQKSTLYINGMGEKDYGQYNIETETEAAPGTAILVKTSTIKEVGLFNENYYMLHEDYEFSYRIRKKGYKIIYVPSAVIFHKKGISTQTENKDRNYLVARNRCLFVNEHLSLCGKVKFYFYIIFSILKDLLKGKLQDGEIRGFIDGFLNKKGKPEWIP